MDRKTRVVIISDLHLGGKHDKYELEGQLISQGKICRSEKWMNEFITWLQDEARSFDGEMELVINGDFIDFLAPNDQFQPDAWTPDEDEIWRRLTIIDEQIQNRLGQSPFDALKSFLLQPNCKLTVLLGNHDIELSMPKVRRKLASRIGATQSNFEFIYDGEACVRGELLIEHGNRYDKWNVIDHSRLRQERSHRSRGLTIQEDLRDDHFFRPPAGTLLVIHALNMVLGECPFLNFVKPETGAGIPLMVAINPRFEEFFDRILKMRPLIPRWVQGRLADSARPASPGNLATKSNKPKMINSLREFLNVMLGKEDAKLFLSGNREGNVGVREEFSSLCERIKASVAAIRGLVDAFFDLAEIGTANSSEECLKKLRLALKCLSKDRSFDPGHELSEYLDAAKKIAEEGGFKTIVFGHTHLPKKVSFTSAKNLEACYINTGSWASVMKVPEKVYSSGSVGRDALKAFFEEMRSGKLLPYVSTYLSYAEIEMEGSRVLSSELRSFCGKQSPRNPVMTEVQA
jgi:UDP-2,3-diacylglucosamine pyrophosphatase LpxH